MPFDPEAYPAEELANQLVGRTQSPQQRVDAVYEEMTSHDRHAAESVKREVDLMTEARVRFAKAALYEQIIEGQLFEGNDAITLEVENEMKAHAEMRMRQMLNIEDEANPQSKLDDEEINVLKLFAAKLMGRPASIPRPAIEAPKVLAKPIAAPIPQPPPLAAPKRGRGRPPGTGKNQRQVAPTVQSSTPRQHPDPVATRQVPRNPPTDSKAGKVVSQVTDDDVKPLPMPSPDEMVAMAADQGERGLRAATANMRNPDAHVVTTTTPSQGY